MNATTTLGSLGDHAVDRRRFLGLIATGAAIVGCRLYDRLPPPRRARHGREHRRGPCIPKYIPVTYVDPDYPSVNGSVPGYETLRRSSSSRCRRSPARGSSSRR